MLGESGEDLVEPPEGLRRGFGRLPVGVAREAGDPAPIRTIEVQRGETLWAIASEIAEPGEIRDMVYTIERLNSLPDATLSEGQVLAVPAG